MHYKFTKMLKASRHITRVNNEGLRKLKKLLSLFLSLLLVITPSFSVSASADRTSSPMIRYLDVTRQQQQKSEWCWAACSSMVSECLFSPYRTQADIVRHVKGSSTIDDGATTTELEEALDYALFGNYDVSCTFRATYEFLAEKIYIDGKPLIFWINWNSGGAHAVVASGCNAITTTFKIVDPWYGCGTSLYPYSAMVNGMTFESGTGKLAFFFYY